MDSITLDLNTLTLGELAAVEGASGQTFDRLLRGSATRMMLALYVHRWRTSGVEPRWSELADLTVSDALSSISVSAPDGAPTSSGG